MDVRIGTTLDGRGVVFDTCSVRPLLLVGDGGRGKTTIARYLARWWLANTVRHAHVYSEAPSEWADLRCDLRGPHGRDQADSRGGCRTGNCLVVIDDLDLIGDDRLHLPTGAARTIVTSHGGDHLTGRLLLDTSPLCWGLVRFNHADLAEAAVLDGQGRLDWPFGTVAIIPDQRGPLDFPCHRWQAPARTWTAAAR